MICSFCGSQDAVRVRNGGICPQCLVVALVGARNQDYDYDEPVILCYRHDVDTQSLSRLLPRRAIIMLTGSTIPMDILTGFHTIYLVPPEDGVAAAVVAAALEAVAHHVIVVKPGEQSVTMLNPTHNIHNIMELQDDDGA